MTSLINGSIDLAIDSMTTPVASQAQSGAIRALAVSTATRSVSAPDFQPAIAETIKGYAVPVVARFIRSGWDAKTNHRQSRRRVGAKLRETRCR